ncbi:MAG: UDP-2,4-diacetamido-2,4,6-trideoxy-beta-L-altropyranose hydrolase [Oleispira sp.]|jgi:UDP-2,4-diacetamido-2,4,6-trideoxy-beta-L-altropyranose hydrolase
MKNIKSEGEVERGGVRNMNVTFIFKCNCSNRIGFGHISRSQIVASEIACLGFSTKFVIRNLPGSKNKFTKKIMDTYWLDSDSDSEAETSFWLEENEMVDAIQTCDVIQKIKKDGEEKIVLIFDNYGITDKWVSVVSEHVDSIVCFDDVPGRKLPVDIVINYNPGIKKSDYFSYIVSRTKMLVGVEFSPLAIDYQKINEGLKLREVKVEEVKRILIFIGAGYAGEFINVLLKALKSITLSKYQFTLVVNLDLFKNNFDVPKNVTVENIGGDMAEILAKHQLVIGSAGVSSLERLCLGVPSLLIQIADNQRELYKFLTDNKYAVGLGYHTDITSEYFISKFISIVDDCDLRLLIKRNGLELIDGFGAKRLADNIINETLKSIEG